ncbi:hypothetical protein NC652_028447 [Populus alba x Populus x berolinensis]|nr:hypothetical protein NC652_028447 [Populus alba x Populus x berolinensis]
MQVEKTWKRKKALPSLFTNIGFHLQPQLQTHPTFRSSRLIKAADRETSSMSLPSRTSSSLTFSDRTIDTPSNMSTFLTFSNQTQTAFPN